MARRYLRAVLVGPLVLAVTALTCVAAQAAPPYPINPGTVSYVGSNTLTLNNGSISFGLRCNSSTNCAGTVGLTFTNVAGASAARASRDKAKACGKSKFSIRADKKTKVNTKLSKACVNLVKQANNQKLKAELSTKISTKQKGFSKKVTIKF